jgi:hypothetical protein
MAMGANDVYLCLPGNDPSVLVPTKLYCGRSITFSLNTKLRDNISSPRLLIGPGIGSYKDTVCGELAYLPTYSTSAVRPATAIIQ